MGKVKIRTIGTEEEEIQKKEQKKKREEKRTVHIPGMKGGQRVVAVGPTEEELARLSASENLSDSVVARKILNEKTATTETQKRKKTRKKAKHVRSKKYQTYAALIDRKKQYPLSEALELLEKLQRKTFDETVELHLNTTTEKISGEINLPHGTGTKTKVAIASDKLILDIEKGKVDFDILLSTPSMMPKLAKVAKILGPKGLMPNPKSGTITEKPEEVAKKYEGGLMQFKSEGKAPILHASVGKVSFGKDKLAENIEAFISTVKKENIKNAFLKSTMSPGIKLQVDKA